MSFQQAPKTFWWAELISQFFRKLNSSKNFNCPLGKLRTEFTSPIAKSTSPGLSDTTFFARCFLWKMCPPIKYSGLHCMTPLSEMTISTKKIPRCLYILRVLKQAGIPSSDLLNVYFAFIHSVRKYCCVLWSNSLPVYLSDKVEQVQKRALHILFPNTHYTDTLVTYWLVI